MISSMMSSLCGIAIANSPIPYITGVDFEAISRVIEQDTGIPTFYIMTNGMHDYVRGAGLALLRLAERFVRKNAPIPGGCEEKETNYGFRRKVPESREPEAKTGLRNHAGRRLRCNILGMTPLDFAAATSLPSLRQKIRAEGIELLSCWAMGSDGRLLEEIRNSADADVNLVISSVGLPAARYLQDAFGIPFVAGIPAAGVEDIFFRAVRRAAETGESLFPFRERRMTAMSKRPDAPVCLIGEPVVMTSLAASVECRTGARTHVFAATEDCGPFLGSADAALRGEEELENALAKTADGHLDRAVNGSPAQTGDENPAKTGGGRLAKTADGHPAKAVDGCLVRVIADPCYADILPEGCELVRLPHLAFSGRIFLKEIPDLFRAGTIEALVR